MRPLGRLFQTLRPRFEDGGRLARLRPVFDAVESFCFAPSEVTEFAPHARDPLDLKRYMATVIVALLPCLVAAVYFFGLRVLAMLVVSYACGGAVEVAFAVVRRHPISEGFLVTGLLFPLILPPATPFWAVGLGVAFGVLVGKEVFGGTGHNPFNPALVGRCFLALAYPATLTSGWITPGTGLVGNALRYLGDSADAVSAATPLVLAKQGSFVPLRSLFWGTVTGSAGETSAAAILLGGAFLLLTRVGNWRTVASVLGSFVLGGVVLQAFFPVHFGPVGFHVLAGGLLFGAFFMATDPVTSPITNGGKWVFGLVVGLSALLIRNLTGYVEGVMFAILLGNISAPLIDQVVFQFRIRRLDLE